MRETKDFEWLAASHAGGDFLLSQTYESQARKATGSLAGFSARLRVPLPEIVCFSDEDNWEKQTDGFAGENRTVSKRFPVFNSILKKDGLRPKRFLRIIIMWYVGKGQLRRVAGGRSRGRAG